MLDQSQPSLTLVFARYGQAALHAQDLEANLVNLLLIHHQLEAEVFAGSSDLSSLESVWSRRTLGALLREVRNRVSVPVSVVDQLTVAADRRNYLVHRFFYDNAESLLVEEALPFLISELMEISTLLSQAKTVVTDRYLALLHAAGISQQKFETMRNQIFADLMILTQEMWQRRHLRTP